MFGRSHSPRSHLIFGFVAGTAGIHNAGLCIDVVHFLLAHAFGQQSIIHEPNIAMLHDCRAYQHTALTRHGWSRPNNLHMCFQIRVCVLHDIGTPRTEPRLRQVANLKGAHSVRIVLTIARFQFQGEHKAHKRQTRIGAQRHYDKGNKSKLFAVGTGISSLTIVFLSGHIALSMARHGHNEILIHWRFRCGGSLWHTTARLDGWQAAGGCQYNYDACDSHLYILPVLPLSVILFAYFLRCLLLAAIKTPLIMYVFYI